MLGSVVVSYTLTRSAIDAPERFAASIARRRSGNDPLPFCARFSIHFVFSAPPISASAEKTASRERSLLSVG